MAEEFNCKLELHAIMDGNSTAEIVASGPLTGPMNEEIEIKFVIKAVANESGHTVSVLQVLESHIRPLDDWTRGE